MKYKAPVNENGDEYFVPIVIKSKEYLVGYLNAVEYMLYVLDFPGEIDLNLDSARFNDVVDDGKRISNMDKDEIEKLILENAKNYIPEEIEKKQKAHPDNKDGVRKREYLELECHCGMFYAFKSSQEVPEHDFNCEVCERHLIEYTGKDDTEYDEFDGDEDKIAEIEKSLMEGQEEDPEDDEEAKE